MGVPALMRPPLPQMRAADWVDPAAVAYPYLVRWWTRLGQCHGFPCGLLSIVTVFLSGLFRRTWSACGVLHPDPDVAVVDPVPY